MMAAVTIFEGTDLAIPKLREFGQAIGLAFQVQDDILILFPIPKSWGKLQVKMNRLKNQPIRH